MKQGSTEWYAARCGKITASNFDCVLVKKGKTGFGDAAMTYLDVLLAERLTGVPQEITKHPVTGESLSRGPAAFDWGHAQESHARAAYQWSHPCNVAEVGFVNHRTLKMVGSSPDGLIREKKGIIEVKCPFTTKVHVRTLRTRQIPKEYVAQVQGNLWVTESDWCDFISYDGRLPEHLQLCVVRVERDEPYIEMLAARVEEFAALVDQYESEFRNDKAA